MGLKPYFYKEISHSIGNYPELKFKRLINENYCRWVLRRTLFALTYMGCKIRFS